MISTCILHHLSYSCWSSILLRVKEFTKATIYLFKISCGWLDSHIGHIISLTVISTLIQSKSITYKQYKQTFNQHFDHMTQITIKPI